MFIEGFKLAAVLEQIDVSGMQDTYGVGTFCMYQRVIMFTWIKCYISKPILIVVGSLRERKQGIHLSFNAPFVNGTNNQVKHSCRGYTTRDAMGKSHFSEKTSMRLGHTTVNENGRDCYFQRRHSLTSF